MHQPASQSQEQEFLSSSLLKVTPSPSFIKAFLPFILPTALNLCVLSPSPLYQGPEANTHTSTNRPGILYFVGDSQDTNPLNKGVSLSKAGCYCGENVHPTPSTLYVSRPIPLLLWAVIFSILRPSDTI